MGTFAANAFPYNSIDGMTHFMTKVMINDDERLTMIEIDMIVITWQ